MAASDQPYRNQHTLDIVFAVSSLVMLASIIWMLMDDYNRPFKAEQRSFREVEAALAQRLAVEAIPSREEFEKAKTNVEEARKAREAQEDKVRELRYQVSLEQPKRERADARYNEIKADVESVASFYNIAKEKGAAEEAREHEARLNELHARLTAAQADRDAIVAKMKGYQQELDAIERPVIQAQGALKKVTDRFDTQVKVAINKQWGFGDWFRTLPILDAAASPIKINQITNDNIPIDYNFKQVTRYDRCQTCHLGIDRPAYTEANLRSLTQVTKEQEAKLKSARDILDERQKALSGLPEASRVPTSGDLRLSTVSPGELTDSRIREYAAHPRLDLYVGANSKHPAEKFGCSACHSGQGSATDFTLAAHTPNDAPTTERWKKEHHWESQHYWDFPMLPTRFVEASCLKCHHQVTDLISSDNRVEAPKLVRGYNLIRENGCFGCHEISGTKAGRAIGPDLRIEPNPPLDELSPSERARAEADAENPPGKLPKVGPSLFRLAEKTNPEWTTKWLRSPRSFRPDTKMPHFYGLSNNHPNVLPADQKDFPDAEMQAITHYLFAASGAYVNDIAAQHKGDKTESRRADADRLEALLGKGKEKLSDEEKGELAKIQQRNRLRNEVVLTDLAPGYKGDKEKGRQLFAERGCLACHSHVGTEKASGKGETPTFSPEVHSDANFGPNLGQVAAKLGKSNGDQESARRWLVQWILNPKVHSPRSRMPVTHLTPEQATDVAAWLLSQPPQDLGDDWDRVEVAAPKTETFESLARVYLVRLLTKSDMEKLFKEGSVDSTVVSELPQDERDFVTAYGKDKENSLKHYVGKKAVGRLGCYACHDVPGFENAKPIGVGLLDWGKKDPTRLAFEDIKNFVDKHYFVADALADKDGKLVPPKGAAGHGGGTFDSLTHVAAEGQGGAGQGQGIQYPYERFFYESLTHHGREGYLHQKILDPRSYDYERLRAWDDRSRMPRFRLARTRQRPGEPEAEYKARAWKEEADARESVMTFVLGLVAEQVPTKMIHQPQGDRLAEVKGRQVLDKYNCAGCHLLRPGAYDFRTSDQALPLLENSYRLSRGQDEANGFYRFPNHHFWAGDNPTNPDRLLASGTHARLVKKNEDGDQVEENEPGKHYVQLRLAEALRFVGTDRVLKDIPAYTTVELPLADLTSDPGKVQSQAGFEQRFAAQQPYGGMFSDIMVKYLLRKDPQIFKIDDQLNQDSGQARASLPPPLIMQGERTQADWLYRFLLDPQPVRRMSILRMPKFNLSRDEARALVDYFAAVERITNPGGGLNYPHEAIPQQQDLTEEFWQQKNSEYVARLKQQGQYEQRLKSYGPVWNQLQKENEAALKGALDKARALVETTEKEAKALQEKLKKADGGQKTALEKEAKEAEEALTRANDAVKKLAARQSEGGVDAARKAWEQREAYAADTYRLLAHRQMCLQCHQVGEHTASNLITQGPPLALANERLRPGWLYRWIATPQRHLTYASVMPVNFPLKRDEKTGEPVREFQNLLAGAPPEQVEALRDVLMNFPRVSSLPVNRQWDPEQHKTIGDKK